MTFDEKSDAAEAALKPLLTNEFLETLVLAAKTRGWDGDYTETVWFVNWCFTLAGKECPDLNAFDYNT